MKKLLLLGFLIPSVLFAQVIPKKANTIIITDTLSQEHLYNKITDLLFENGYGILNTDKAQGTITTTQRAMRTGTVALVFLIKDKRVILRGNAKGLEEISGDDLFAIEYRGMKGSIYRDAWDEMQKVSDNIPGTKEYLVK
jgi:hypothetical protein